MYSVNQVNQLYVVKAIKAIAGKAADDNAGTLYGSSIGTNNPAPILTAEGLAQYFQYKGSGGLIATDRIKKGKVKWVTYTPAAAMTKNRRTWTITVPGTVTAGKDYIINFSFRNYFGMSDEDTYEKFAAVHSTSSTTKAELIGRLAISLAKNMSREVDWPFTIQVTTGTSSSATSGTARDVTELTKLDDILATTGSSQKHPINIILTEKIQPWSLGRLKATRPDFEVTFVPVDDSSEWGNSVRAEISDDTNPITNGRETADLEWFCMGERGDQYRGKDWPLSITTPASLLVDSNGSYDYVVVHFWDDIDNEGPQKSERDMTFVMNSSITNAATIMDNLAKNIAQNAGLESYTKVALDSNSGKYKPTTVTVGLTARVETLENAE